MLDLSLAVGHHLLVFALFGVLVAELVLVRRGLGLKDLRRTQAIDLWYGVLALAILALGFTRAVFAAKGWSYYQHNLVFWAKVATFVFIGVLSVPPTLAYLRWKRHTTPPGKAEIAKVRRFLWAQTVLFALLPVFAALMARGYGADTI